MNAPVAIAVPGHNNPPTPFDLMVEHIMDLFGEAKNWADGTSVETQDQADAVSLLIDSLRKSGKDFDDLRVAEKRPLDEAIKAIQDRYNPFIQKDKGKVDLAIASLKSTLAPYLRKLDDEKRAIAEKARQEAEAARLKALEAMQASRSDLDAREEAERLATEAKALERTAARASKDKAGAHGGTRAMTLRSVWTVEIVNETEAVRSLWAAHRAEFVALAKQLAEADVRAGKREIAGFTITEERVPV